MRPLRAWVAAGLVIGVADLADAFLFFGLRGVSPVRILQSIASGVLGPAAFSGAAAAAALGVALHLLIAFAIAGVYLFAALRLETLRRRWLLWGPLYGILVYAVMNVVVIPLSRAAGGMPALPVLINGLVIHVVGVGLPAAWFASRLASPGVPAGGGRSRVPTPPRP